MVWFGSNSQTASEVWNFSPGFRILDLEAILEFETRRNMHKYIWSPTGSGPEGSCCWTGPCPLSATRGTTIPMIYARARAPNPGTPTHPHPSLRCAFLCGCVVCVWCVFAVFYSGRCFCITVVCQVSAGRSQKRRQSWAVHKYLQTCNTRKTLLAGQKPTITKNIATRNTTCNNRRV